MGDCSPISSLEAITDVIDNPPKWTNRVIPLVERSATVVQNTISDCHYDQKKFTCKLRQDRRFIPRTLVCHDYKGGYLEDRLLSSSNTGNLYSFYNWSHIDIFVYFSHHLITIPPLCWINTAHRNGVKILGTIITEFEPGTKICESIFKDEDTMRIFATSLSKILQIFKFDGWLLNIENPLSDTGILKKFVEYLRLSTHAVNPNHLVIWYDSVVETGQLNWQNELNISNKFFFDHCDGIFLNYVWKEENVERSVAYAKHRPLDVYVGIDVFGRNTFGGGQFNCFKAAQIIRRHGLSMAIFAPGWTHETLPKNENADAAFNDFVNRDLAFWNSLWPYLYTHPIPHFFKTNFFIGVDQETYNMFSQHQQLSKIPHPNDTKIVPNFDEITTLNAKCRCLKTIVTPKGVRCLITKAHLSTASCYIHSLFICDIALNGSTLVYVLTSAGIETQGAVLSLCLLTLDQNGAVRKIKCVGEPSENPVQNISLMEVNPSGDEQVLQHVSKLYDQPQADLNITAYTFSTGPCQLLEIGATLDKGTEIELCGFGIGESYIPVL